MAGDIQEIVELVDEANRSSRSLTFQLSPPILHDLGFEPALQWLVEDVARTHGLEISLEGPADASQISERVMMSNEAERCLAKTEVRDAQNTGDRPHQQQQAPLIDTEPVDQQRRQQESQDDVKQRAERIPAGIAQDAAAHLGDGSNAPASDMARYPATACVPSDTPHTGVRRRVQAAASGRRIDR